MVANGRSERRIQQIWDAEISLSEESVPQEKTVTENVSPHGARVTTTRCWQPGTRVLVTLPRNGVQFEGRVAYCQRKASGVFAIGVEVAA